jgi:hypothetical protein
MCGKKSFFCIRLPFFLATLRTILSLSVLLAFVSANTSRSGAMSPTQEINTIDLSLCGIQLSSPQMLTHEKFELTVCAQNIGRLDAEVAELVINIPDGIKVLDAEFTKTIPHEKGSCIFAEASQQVVCYTQNFNSGGYITATFQLVAHKAQGYEFVATINGDRWRYDPPTDNIAQSEMLIIVNRRETQIVLDAFEVWIEEIPVNTDSKLKTNGGIQVKIRFGTSQEIEVASFRILRRDITADQQNYDDIATIQPRGIGDSGALYEYCDRDIEIDHIYGYRLVMLGFDGSARTTPERVVNIDILHRVFLPIIRHKQR